ncbi:dual oxidase 1-like [Watersipora subatra]|uniref:dual oxidase 1-like n=1 Tax=Watersipora subatra TaxID=2589382 RepID=UPI00355B7FBD
MAPGPNARHITRNLLKGPSGIASPTFTALFPYFGQLISREIMDIDEPSCPRELCGIDVSDDSTFTKNREKEEMIMMPVYRSNYDKKTGVYSANPRKQVNGATSWIDGSFIYGPSGLWSDALRKFQDGLLDLDDNGLPPLNKKGLPLDNFPPPSSHKLAKPTEMWAFGDKRAHENPAIMSLSILFMRYHNAVAKEMQAESSSLNDRELFVKARLKTTAVLQSIIMYEWLPLLLNKTADDLSYVRYEPSIAPQIDSIYAAVASKWVMTLMPSGIPVRQESGCGADQPIRLCESWFDGQRLIEEYEGDLARNILLGLAAMPAEREDQIIAEDLLDYSFGPLHFSRMDAAAEYIIRARDFGVKVGERFVADHQHYDNWIELFPYLNLPEETEQVLKDLYGEMSNMDTFILAILERDNSTQTYPGYTIKTTIERQLTRLRDADFFWFENKPNGLFEDDEIAEIKAIKMADVLAKALGEFVDVVDAFSIKDARCQIPLYNASNLPDCSGLKTFDYFAGNEFAFIASWIWIGLFPLVVIGLAYGAYTISENRRKQGHQVYRKELNASVSAIANMTNLTTAPSHDSGNVIYASEWVGEEEVKNVRVVLDNSKYVLYVQTVEGIPIRSANLAVYEILTVHVCPKSPFTVLIELPKSYDLVLRFSSHDHSQRFCAKLNTYVYENGKLLVRQPASWKAISRRAVTKSRRKENLNSFFRNVFAQAFNNSDMRSREPATNREIIEFEISKEEFADSLGMKANSRFVELMFNVADKQKRGFLRFREILELVIIMSKGSPDRKLELLFDMFDFSGNGKIARTEMSQVVRSLVDLAGPSKHNSDLEPIVNEMYDCAGLSDKDELNFDEFKRLLTSKDENFMLKVGVDWKGVKKTPAPKKTRSKILGTSHKQLKLESLPDSMNSVLHSKDSVRRGSNYSQRDIGSLATSASSLSVDDLESAFSDDAASVHSARIGFCDTPDQTLDRRNAKKPASLQLKHEAPPKFDPKTAKYKAFIHYIENRKREIAVLFFFYAVCTGLFVERFIYYYHSNEHNGARQTLSLGVAFARGAAEVISFTFSILLITMCYNMVRFMRETVLNLYIPFDKNIVFHKIVAWTALAFTAVHTVAYGFNYYFLASGPASHACFFKTTPYDSDAFIRVGPTLYTSLPGVTGVLLLLTLIVMYIFASQTARRYMHSTFWIVHKLFIFLYILMTVHGLLWLTQKPQFFTYFIGPCTLYIIDKVLSVTRRKMKLKIIEADILPSNVTRVLFKRPANFEYKSGMWVRIACDALGVHEYHPFTLTSSPHEDFLSLHVRGVGPWTLNLRSVMEASLRNEREMPNVYVDGPFGSGQQDWYNFEVSVLVGAGIGVTPYASILKDFVHMMRTKNRFKIKCQKVYFIWSTNNQRSFEWLIDILKQVEEVDINSTVSTNIFITQFFQGFDLRTSMLYVFEEHAKKLGGASLFTGLKATTNFGRPKFLEIFKTISEEHLRVKNIGVFSCGPPALTKGVEQACIKSSATTHSQFQHHYENF